MNIKETEFLKEIHENQIKAYEERVKSGLTLKEYLMKIEKETENVRKLWGVKKYKPTSNLVSVEGD